MPLFRFVRAALPLTALWLACTPALAQTAPDVPAPLAQADSLWKEGRFEAALRHLEALEEAEPEDDDVLWRLARVKADLGEEAQREDEKERWYRAAHEDAAAAVRLDSADADAYVARAIAAGRVGLISGTREKVRLSREVKESVDRAIALDSANVLAYHIRGRWHYEVASLGFFSRAALRLVYGGLPDASYEKALRDLQHANAIQDLVANHVELGKTYRKLGEEAEARAAFERAIELPSVYPNDERYKQQAQARLEELG